MSEDWIVVPHHVCSIKVSCGYDHPYTSTIKSLPQTFAGGPHLSTTSSDCELVDGRKNWDTETCPSEMWIK